MFGSKKPRKKFFTFRVRFFFYVVFALTVTSLISFILIHDDLVEKRRPILPVAVFNNIVITNSDPLLEEIKRDLNLYYFQNLTPEEMEDNMRKGMVEHTHKYCYYIEKDDAAYPKKVIGALIASRSGHYIVRYVAPNSPAEFAGLREGDEIVSINNKNITHIKDAFSQEDYFELDKIVLGIIRNKNILNITLQKKAFSMPSVIYKKLDNFLYIQIRNFGKQTGKEFADCIDQFPNTKGYVIDLRNNPGGSVNVCKFITSYFLPPGKPLFIEKIKNSSPYTHLSFVKESCTNKPLVILINENSYSASEIFAAVLQYYKRALVVGEQSGGKGIAQLVVELSNGDSLHIPNSYLFLPDGTTWNENGVVPDYEVASGLPIWTFSNILPQNDPQLKKALNLLKIQTKKLK
jgi:carboxyl-terminal processing protease